MHDFKTILNDFIQIIIFTRKYTINYKNHSYANLIALDIQWANIIYLVVVLEQLADLVNKLAVHYSILIMDYWQQSRGNKYENVNGFLIILI